MFAVKQITASTQNVLFFRPNARGDNLAKIACLAAEISSHLFADVISTICRCNLNYLQLSSHLFAGIISHIIICIYLKYHFTYLLTVKEIFARDIEDIQH